MRYFRDRQPKFIYSIDDKGPRLVTPVDSTEETSSGVNEVIVHFLYFTVTLPSVD